ncbi:MAG: SPOR domain-containing protein, partial [Bacteroidetes bacterium]|nr:SPOR domain-containing protein [Bacteroidota bacterium]
DNFKVSTTEATLATEDGTVAVDAAIEITTTEENHTISLSPIKTESKRYYIVVGSFKIEENALTLAEELQADGHEVTVLPGSLMKVGLGGFESREQAKSALAAIKAEVNSYAWIYAY